MNIISKASTAVLNHMGTLPLKLRKASPTICLVVGIGGFVGTTILASRATLKAQEVLDECKANLDIIKEAAEKEPEKYTEADRKSDLKTTYGKAIGGFVKLYAPAVAMGAMSIFMLVKGHRILQKEIAGLSVAYQGVMEAYNKYREAVSKHFGETAEKEIANGVEVTKESVVDAETGNEIEHEEKRVVSPNVPYHATVDRTNEHWCKNPVNTWLQAKSIQAKLNSRCAAKGFLSLNEAREALDLPWIPEGQFVGWYKNGKSRGVVDFGLADRFEDQVWAQVNYSDALPITFNVDGNIYNVLKSLDETGTYIPPRGSAALA